MKKIIAAVLCLMLAAGLCGCGCGSKNNDTKSDKKTEESAKTEDGENADENGDDSTGNKLNILDDSDNSNNSNNSNSSDNSDNSSASGTTDDWESVDADNLTGTVELGSAEVEKNAEETIYITASENTPVAAFEFDLIYDPALFEIVEYGFTDDFTGAYSGMYIANDVDGETVFTGVNTDQSEQYYTGTVAYVKVKCLGESGTSGNITLKVPSLSTFDGTNRSGNFEFKGSTITIK